MKRLQDLCDKYHFNPVDLLKWDEKFSDEHYKLL